MTKNTDISSEWIQNYIEDFIVTATENNMRNETREPAWRDALVGFASGADPLWQQYKEPQ